MAFGARNRRSGNMEKSRQHKWRCSHNALDSSWSQSLHLISSADLSSKLARKPQVVLDGAAVARRSLPVGQQDVDRVEFRASTLHRPSAGS
jgi:hypothetical protein